MTIIYTNPSPSLKDCVKLQYLKSLSTVSFVTLYHKNSLKCQLFQIEIYTASESWINKLSIDV